MNVNNHAQKDRAHPWLRRAAWLVPLALVGLTAVVACGSTAPQHASPSPSSGGTKSLAVLWAEWAGCMRAHGANIPDPQVNDTGGVNIQSSGDQLALDRANVACKTLKATAEAAEPNHGRPNRLLMVRYAQCMRAHGVTDFPDPDADGTIMGTSSTPFMNSPAFASASRACAPVLTSG